MDLVSLQSDKSLFAKFRDELEEHRYSSSSESNRGVPIRV